MQLDPKKEKKLLRLAKLEDKGNIAILEDIDLLEDKVEAVDLKADKAISIAEEALSKKAPQGIQGEKGEKGDKGDAGKDGKDAPLPDTNVVAYEASKMAEEELTKLIPKLDDGLQLADKLNEHEEVIDQKVIIGLKDALDVKVEEGIAKGMQRGGGSGGIFLYADGLKKGKVNTIDFTGSAVSWSKINGLDTLTFEAPDLSGYVPYTGATADLNLGVHSLISHSIKGDATDGIILEASNGTDIGILGAGNTANVTWYGNHNFSTATQDTIAGFTGTGKTLGSLSTSTYPSLTELSYVKGVTSGIQTQISGLVPYTGATGSVNLGAYNLSLTNLTPTGDIDFLGTAARNITTPTGTNSSDNGTAFSINVGAGYSGTQGTTGGSLDLYSGAGGTTSDDGLNAGNGGAVNIGSGAGGISSGLGNPQSGNGGDFAISTGAGGNGTYDSFAGVGGSFSITTGVGGSVTGSSGTYNLGSAGGAIYISTGAGGAGTNSTDYGQGADGGAMTFTTGIGGIGRGTNYSQGGVGGAMTFFAGNGGSASTSTTYNQGGDGGALSLYSGNGGASANDGAIAGNGGNFQFVGGNGGTSAISGGTQGTGGNFYMYGGGGGGVQVSGGNTNTGATGGSFVLSGGSGGVAGLSTTFNQAGDGGTFTLTGGQGGNASTGSGTRLGGGGGSLSITGGAGGTSNSGTGGNGGNLYIAGGAGGGASPGTPGVVGNLFLGVISAGTARGTVMVGTTTITGGKLQVRATTEQLRLEYDSSNRFTTTVGSTGGVTFDAVGSGAAFTFSDAVTINSSLTLSAQNIITDTTTGMKIGTATNQKIGFYNKAPAVQPTALTTQLTDITFTAPGTPDYAIQDLIDSASGSAFGFATKDEGNTVLSVIKNLQTRVAELETKLQSVGLLA